MRRFLRASAFKSRLFTIYTPHSRVVSFSALARLRIVLDNRPPAQLRGARGVRSRSRGRVALPATLSLLVRYCAAHGWCEDAVRTRAECTCSTAVFVHERSQHAAFAHPPPPRAPVRNRRHMHETKPPHPGPSFRSTGARSIGPHRFTSFQLPACRCHPHTDSHGLTRAAGLPYANARFSGIMRCEGAYASSPTRGSPAQDFPRRRRHQGYRYARRRGRAQAAR